MSYSLRIENGDLMIGNNRSLEVVTGKAKLFQDLALWILERVGTDPATPTYGSTLDGGVVDGQELPSFIGQLPTAQNLNLIKSEVLDLLHQYQQMQIMKMKQELIEYDGKHTLKGDEVLHRIDSVEIRAIDTLVLVRVVCTTLDRNTLNVTIPLAA